MNRHSRADLSHGLSRSITKIALAAFAASVWSAGVVTADQTPATITTESSGSSTMLIPGQGSTPFSLHTPSVMYNGTRDDQFVIAYNHKTSGGRYSLSEPQIRLALEADYFDGRSHLIEYNLDTVAPDSNRVRRWMHLGVDRGANPHTGFWTFWGSNFTLQNYNTPESGVPTEYFTVTHSGIARLTSMSGSASQLLIDTTDSTGYPGSYASVAFQEARTTRWLLSNQGANGDRLQIRDATGEVASFTQNGAFASKGQRVAVTTRTSSYAATVNDSVIRANASAGPVTISLPSATGSGQVYRVKKVDSTGNAVMISSADGSVLDASASATLSSQYQAVTLVDGAPGVWDIIYRAQR